MGVILFNILDGEELQMIYKFLKKYFLIILVFDKSIKPGDLMIGAMSEDSVCNWFGVAPPDLTLVIRV
jgi:hypothetical protein